MNVSFFFHLLDDSYAGGNPWPLLTASLAELFYQGATTMLTRSLSEEVQAHEYEHVQELLKLGPKPTRSEVAAAYKSAGDAVMYRLYTHVKNDNYRVDE